MKRWSTIAIALFAAALAAIRFAPDASGQAAGWVTLFDGKNLDQWIATGHSDVTYQIEDGSVVAHKKDPKSTVNLLSKQAFTDFELRAEFWVGEDANSGIYIRCTNPTQVNSKSAYEVNLYDTRPDPSYGTGAIVGVAKVDPMPKAGGKWGALEITAKGDHLIVILNGVKTADAKDNRFAAGPIALQYGVGVVKFRKVEIKRL